MSDAGAERREEGKERRQKGSDSDYSGPERRGSADRRLENNRQFSTFYISDRLYGIDVAQVQEITRALPMTAVPLSPAFVHGLINLRGQISTAIGLRELFDLKDKTPEEQMNVVCRADGILLSFLVDRIGDVMDVADFYFEESPNTVSRSVRRFMKGVYKLPKELLSIVDVKLIIDFLNKESLTSN